MFIVTDKTAIAESMKRNQTPTPTEGKPMSAGTSLSANEHIRQSLMLCCMSPELKCNPRRGTVQQLFNPVPSGSDLGHPVTVGCHKTVTAYRVGRQAPGLKTNLSR
jgi:hypothetical protein